MTIFSNDRFLKELSYLLFTCIAQSNTSRMEFCCVYDVFACFAGIYSKRNGGLCFLDHILGSHDNRGERLHSTLFISCIIKFN